MSINNAERALLDFIDEEFAGIYQALIMARNSNTADAERLEKEPDQGSPQFPGSNRQMARLMRESAQSWDLKAQELSRLYDALPQEG